MLRIKRAYFNIDWHEKESICAQRLADLSRLRPILKGAGWLSVRFPRTAFFGSTGQAGTGRFHLSGPKTVTDGAFLPDPQIHAPGTGSGKERIYPPPQKKDCPRSSSLLLLRADLRVCGFYGDNHHPPRRVAQAQGGTLGPTGQAQGLGLRLWWEKVGLGPRGGLGVPTDLMKSTAVCDSGNGVIFIWTAVLVGEQVWGVVKMKIVERQGSSDLGVWTVGSDPDSPLTKARELRYLIPYLDFSSWTIILFTRRLHELCSTYSGFCCIIC